MTAFTGVDSQNLPDVMVSVQFILAIGEIIKKCQFFALPGLQLNKIVLPISVKLKKYPKKGKKYCLKVLKKVFTDVILCL
ncbi:hypothetical protein IAF88_07730 [Lactobacillus delbrueckii subsp. lactis]|uniref:hypothetical protein n=1 Tax=Lactobacillus delbrueckii TaxID=1584 RepID=UPI001A999FB9|nr:hypothetical protein [Lactobacillus delbrueckii]MBO1175691.1 hypothetical protein [Lactobacillus delbrueckii subsp. lactis]MBO1184439.1 hypothetical protein [Lactobacillus delbrueckii subsp. lactis]MCD5575496.1 hypothetical protein [Lactobacillus delbrueckii subsp. lactis]